jgi:transketolase
VSGIELRMSSVPQRQSYALALAEYADSNHDVVVLDADVSSSTLTSLFASRHPERFFNFGVTEASMVDIGVGFALAGKIPFVNTFAALLTLRACEQVRTCVAYAATNVKLVGGFAGVSDYKDGATHYSTNDIAIMRSMPNMVVISPADNIEAARMVGLAAEYNGPVYMRVSRAPVPDIFWQDYQPEIGKGTIVRDGGDVTIVSTGVVLGRCLLAAQALGQVHVDARVLSLSTIKPLHHEMILQTALDTGAMVTVEEHSVLGGLGSAVAETLAHASPVPIEIVGLEDAFPVTGPDPESLMDACGLSVEAIVAAVTRVLERKRKGPRKRVTK